MIPVYKPYLNEKILEKAHKALDSTWISSKGKYITEVEDYLTNIHSVNQKENTTLTCSSGTAATHLISRLLNVSYPKIKKIIVPNNVYIAAWNAFLYDDFFELEAIDADLETWNLNKEMLYEALQDSILEETAFLAVHNIGNIVNVPQIQRDWKNLVIVEDNCEGFFGDYEGFKSGTLSFASSLSFFGNKNVTSGEGGAITTDIDNREFLYRLKSQGQSSSRFIHDYLGYNYRMTNIQAAILMRQLECMEEIKQKKIFIFNKYKEMLSDIEEVSFQKEEPGTSHSNWMFGIRIKGKKYSEMEKIFNKNFIEVRPMFYPINTHRYLAYFESRGKNNNARTLNDECVILPSYPELKIHEMAHIVNVVKSICSV